MKDLSELVRYLAAAVVDDESQVRVSVKKGRETTYFLNLAAGDEGRVIGRSGRVIQAIRTLTRAAAEPRERVQVDLVNKR